MSEEKNCEEKECCCKIWKVVLLVVVAYTFLTTTYMAVKLGVFDPRSPIHWAQTAGGNANAGQDIKISEKYDKGQSFAKAQATGKPMVVWFYVDWCGYCVQFAPVFDKVIKTKEFKNNMSVAFVNCEDPANQELMKQYNIEGFPTVYIVKPDGSRVHIDNANLFAPDADRKLVKEFLEAAGVGGKSKESPEAVGTDIESQKKALRRAAGEIE